MHSHCAMSNERESEKGAQHQCVTMQTLTALNRMSPWTTCTSWLERESKTEPILQLCLRRLQAAQISHEASLIDQPCFAPSLGEGEHWYAVTSPFTPLPTSHLVDIESSVKGRPLHQHHLGSLVQPWATHILMTNTWLLMNPLPLCAVGRPDQQ